MPQENLLNYCVSDKYSTMGPHGNFQGPKTSINIWFDLSILGITSYTIIIISEYSVDVHISNGNSGIDNEKEIIRIPSLPKDIFTIIKQIDASNSECNTKSDARTVNKSDARRTVDIIKKKIEDKLDEDPILRQLRKFNIVDEIQQLKKSTLPSKEITELQTTTSTLKSDTLQLTKLVEDSKYCSVQSSLKISHLLQEKEKHDSEMSTMKSSVSQLQEDMKMLFRKTSELHYENTLLKKMLEEKIKTESTGLSFTQANTIGQALMQQDVFNCM
jgi:hypothetical protein